jgi:MoxR-like ATPase
MYHNITIKKDAAGKEWMKVAKKSIPASYARLPMVDHQFIPFLQGIVGSHYSVILKNAVIEWVYVKNNPEDSTGILECLALVDFNPANTEYYNVLHVQIPMQSDIRLLEWQKIANTINGMSPEDLMEFIKHKPLTQQMSAKTSNTSLEITKGVAAVKSKFIKADKVCKILTIALKTGKNAMLYGRGGHAKSDMTTAFFEAMGLQTLAQKQQAIKEAKKAKVSKEDIAALEATETLFVQALGQGTQIEHLLGGINMQKFQKEGILEYMPENSFMNSEYVILEEALDAPMQVLEQLKDILTSRALRLGTQYFPIKTKVIIICTNRTREEVAEDNSLKAMMERFPLECKVEWDSYDAKDYNEMFHKVTGRQNPTFAELVAETSKVVFISPRTAIHALAVFEMDGLSGLEVVAGFDPHQLKRIQQVALQREKVARLRAQWVTIHKRATELKEEWAKAPKDSAIKAAQMVLAINEFKRQLNNVELPDDLFDSRNTLIKELENDLNGWQKAATNLVRNDDVLIAKVGKVFAV